MKKNFLFSILILGLFSCKENSNLKNTLAISDSETDANTNTNVADSTLQQRFATPDGFTRTQVADDSFAAYLRNLPLKPKGSKVLYYNGAEKNKPNVYCAVVNLPIGKLDLHQCADAVMRLRAEYLYDNKRYNEIHFILMNGFDADLSTWTEGYSIKVNGNNTSWAKTAEASDSYDTFWSYMEFVFTYAGTLSLEKQLTSKPMNQLEIGDVLIRGGAPGHAVIVVDKAYNSTTKEVVYMLAQSYMPAQETQILVNPNNEKYSPWYVLNNDAVIQTPEWDFENTQLRSF